jgi:cytoskeleton protein RodZ
MSEFENQILDTVTASAIGETLNTRREAMGLSIETVCARLRISQRQVLAMEANDFDVLGEAMIVRGFVRNYAKLLEIDSEPLVEQLKSIKPNNTPKSLTLSSANIPINAGQKQDWQKYIILSAVIALLVVGWIVYTDYQSQQVKDLAVQSVDKVKQTLAPAINQVSNLDLDEVTKPLTETPTQTAENNTTPEPPKADASVLPNNAQPVNTPPQISADALASQPNLVNGESKLRFKSTESSWVHVLDANNKVILDAIVPAQGEAFAQGKAPFNVVIGNAPASTIAFNDQSINLVPYTKGRVARLKLE